jgi:ABC-2 type transport system permease protein
VFGEVVGPALGIDYWVADLAVPFHHLPRILSGGQFSPAPLVALTAVAAALTAAGALRFVRRDMT